MELHLAFPMFAFEDNDHDYSIDRRKESQEWRWSWRPDLRGGSKQGQFLGLLEILISVVLSEMYDKWSWNLACGSEFTIKDTGIFIIFIDDAILPHSGLQKKWNTLIPIKVNIF